MILLLQSAPAASTVFYVTLLLIFLTAIVTTVATKWARDKCLKFFNAYRVTLERGRGQTIWGRLKVFPTGVEMVYDHPYIDTRGRQKTSFMIYQPEIDQQVHSVVRYEADLSERMRQRRRRQVRRMFNPGPLRRLWRGVRNFVNTLRDAFNAAIGAAVSQYQRINPAAGTVLATQAGSVTQIGQTLVGRFANAYEPLLEQYIGQPVILDVADPINPNNATVEYVGYLADYTSQFIAVFNVEHAADDELSVVLPDVDRGDALAPLPSPPPPGAPAPVLPAPLLAQHELAVRIDGARFKIQNLRHESVTVDRLERAGQPPLDLKMIIPPSGTLDLPARDARGGTLVVRPLRCVDVVAPRRFATVRHAGQLVTRRGLMEEMYLDRLPLVSQLFGEDERPGK